MLRTSSNWWSLTRAFLLAAMVTTVALPAGGEGSEENAIKSAIVFNIMKFVEWPEAGAAYGDSFVLGVAGAVKLETAITNLAGRSMKGSELRVRCVDTLEQAEGCHALYLGEDLSSEELGAYLALRAELPMLTLSDRDGFCAEGGMIELVRQRNKLRFRVHRALTVRENLKISSQLLKMALLFEAGR